jgi:hypothetical protein
VGHFYSNITIRADVAAVVAGLTEARVPSFVSIEEMDTFVVVDAESEERGLDVLASMAMTLSHRHRAPCLAASNHHDDSLMLGLYESGVLTSEYGWSNSRSLLPATGRKSFVTRVRTAFGSSPRQARSFFGDDPDRHSLKLRLISFFARKLFAVEHHRLIVAEMGLSDAAVGFSYRDITRGDVPRDQARFRRAWPAA